MGIVKIFLGVVAGFAMLAALVGSVWWVIDYFESGVLWHLIIGGSGVLAFGTFWVYMRTNYWHD